MVDQYGEDVWAQQERDRIRREEEEKKRREERQRLMQMQQPGAQQAQGGIDPSQAMSMYQSFAGGGGSSGVAAGGMGGGATGGTAAGGGASTAAGGFSAWPLAAAAAITAHHMWAKNKGMHDNKDALLGRALYKDADWYQPRANEKVDGMGDEIKLASLGSSPADLLRKDTWSQAAKLAVKGGIAGKILKKIF